MVNLVFPICRIGVRIKIERLEKETVIGKFQLRFFNVV